MLSSPRGKIELSESLKTRSILRRQLVCSYDEFSTDTRMNRILKATIMLLIRSDIDKVRKKALRRLLPYFVDVEDVNLSGEDWHMRFDRNNQTYRMLMNVCWLVVKGLLQTRESGSLRMMDFLDEQRMSTCTRSSSLSTTDVSTQSFPRGRRTSAGRSTTASMTCSPPCTPT